MTLSNELKGPQFARANGGEPDPGALIIALSRLRTRTTTGLQLRDLGPTRGPYTSYAVRGRAPTVPPAGEVKAYWPKNTAPPPNMWRPHQRNTVSKPGTDPSWVPDLVPAAAVAVPIAGALAARVLVATGQHLGPAALAALLALGLNDLARQLRAYLNGDPRFMEIIHLPTTDYGGEGWVENTNDLIADPPWVGIRSDQAGKAVQRFTANYLSVSTADFDPAYGFSAAPYEITLPYTGSHDVTGYGEVAPLVSPTDHWTVRHWYPLPGALPFDVTSGIILIDNPAPARQRWADHAPSAGSPWPQGYHGGYHPPIDNTVQAAAPSTPFTAAPTNLGRRARERKARVVSPAMQALLANSQQGKRLLEWLLEGGDAIGAIFKALPPQIRSIIQQQWYEEEFARGNMQPGTISADAMAAGIVREWRYLDVNAVVRELAWETTQDMLYGLQGQALANALSRIFGNRFQGAQSTISPNWDHHLDPTLPFAGPRRVRDPVTKRMVEIAAGPLHGVMQEITGRAERDAAYRRDPSVDLWRRQYAETQRRKADRVGRRNRERDYAIWRNGRQAGGYVDRTMNRGAPGYNSNPKGVLTP